MTPSNDKLFAIRDNPTVEARNLTVNRSQSLDVTICNCIPKIIKAFEELRDYLSANEITECDQERRFLVNSLIDSLIRIE